MENIDIINSVVSVLVTDGQIQPQESEFLQRLCEQLDVSNDVVETAFEKFVQGESYVYLPKDDEEKEQLLTYLLEAAVADGTVAPQERGLLEAVVKGLKIPHDHFERMLNELLEKTASSSGA